ncbi:mechanosensitive ion channel [Croceibacterium sp. LX-88]|jgi:small-conductance mechanosensitive channel|uniref:Mechanosensitive ion channel n=1 Tax=Croceibacterium selenioxidans TaxID=2838833 RepID=A0ABS5W7W0_9SPHN|nr:mechanosensitive ion channel domain-containing protein [Croceibacterium selenioxidans]MBT2135857.1 mechanosensitive ion channel [Croceibacterium selenioxidans]
MASMLLPASSPSPEATATAVAKAAGNIEGADALKDVVTEKSMTAGTVVEWLDSFGFALGSTRISVWGVIVVLAVIIGLYVFARVGSKVAHRLFARLTALDPARRLLGEKLLSIVIWLIAIFIGIDLLGIDLTALTVFSGAFGLAIGFGLQKTFGNLLAGIILLMDRSIKPGDVIAVNDGISNTVGQVKKIGLRAVSVTTRDMKEYLIPNENLMINQVENWSYSSRNVRVRLQMVVDHSADLDLAETLMIEAAKASPRVLNLPPPAAWITQLTEDGVFYEIRIWINDPEDGLANVRSDVLKRIWRSFRENNVPIPNRTTRQVHLDQTEALKELIAVLREAKPGETPKNNN